MPSVLNTYDKISIYQTTTLNSSITSAVRRLVSHSSPVNQLFLLRYLPDFIYCLIAIFLLYPEKLMRPLSHFFPLRPKLLFIF